MQAYIEDFMHIVVHGVIPTLVLRIFLLTVKDGFLVLGVDGQLHLTEKVKKS